MKSTFYTFKNLVLILSIIAFASCDEVDELTEVDFSTTITEEVTINLSQNSDNINGVIAVNLANNSDISPYLSKLEDIQITQASYKLKNYVGAEDAMGSLSATAAGESFGPFQHTFFTDAQNGTVFNFNASQLNSVSNTLSATNALNIQFSGTQTPAQDGSFVLEVTLDLDVTAQAL
jgi:hypothetical protein